MDRFVGLFQSEPVRNEFFEGYGAAEDKIHVLSLNVHGCAVAPHQRLLVHANGSGVDGDFAMLCLRKEHHAASGSDSIHRRTNKGIAANRYEHSIGTAAIGHRTDLRNDISIRCIEGLKDTEFPRRIQPLCIQIGADDARAFALAERTEYGADGALSHDQYRFTFLQTQILHAFQTRVDWLNETCLLKTHI